MNFFIYRNCLADHVEGEGHRSGGCNNPQIISQKPKGELTKRVVEVATGDSLCSNSDTNESETDNDDGDDVYNDKILYICDMRDTILFFRL